MMMRSHRRGVTGLPFAKAVPLALVVTLTGLVPALAQTPRDPAALRTQIERRFDVLPLRDGVALHPKFAGSGVRSIEITAGAVAIDGQSVTGAELRSRLGGDADAILQLSYLDDAQRRALFGAAPSPGSPPAEAVAPPLPPAPPTPPEPPAVRPNDTERRVRARRDRGDRVRFGGSVTVTENESVAGDVVVVGGSADIDGEVTGDVVVVGGSLRLGPHADVLKDAVIVGGSLDRDPAARVGGRVQEVGVGALNFDGWRPRRGFPRDWWSSGLFGSTFSLVATLIRVGVLGLLAALVVVFARDYVDRVGARAAAEPLKAGAIGFLAQLLFLPLLIVTIVLFLITIVGIPLLVLIPFALLALLVFSLAGFTAVATHAGRWLAHRFGWPDYGPVATTVLGVLVIASPLLLARLLGLVGGPLWLFSTALAILGFCAEYAAWTLGIGAVALQRFSVAPGSASGGESLTGPETPAAIGPVAP